MNLNYRRLKMPMKSPFTTSFGTSWIKDVLVFHLENDGINAYSECITNESPFYGPEDNFTSLHIIKEFISEPVKKLPRPCEYNEAIGFVKGNNMAKAAMEMLLFDYHSKVENIALDRYLDKESKNRADVGISIGMNQIDVTLKKIEESVKEGYKRIKVKIKKGEERNILSSVRDSFPEIKLSADANCDFTEKDFELLTSLDRYELEYLEQPLYHDDLLFHSKLSKKMETPICLDESIVSPKLAENALEMEACNIINIKPGRVGGLFNSMEIARITREFGGHCWVGGMLETGIGRSFNIAFASSSRVDFPGDSSPNDRYFQKDIVTNPFIMENGTIVPNKQDGIGVTIDRTALEKYTVEKGVIF